MTLSAHAQVGGVQFHAISDWKERAVLDFSARLLFSLPLTFTLQRTGPSPLSLSHKSSDYRHGNSIHSTFFTSTSQFFSFYPTHLLNHSLMPP